MSGEPSFQHIAWPRLAPGSGESPAITPHQARSAARPALRLVGFDHNDTLPAPTPAAAAALRERRRAVERENRASADLLPDDTRAILATRAYEALEGGPAAILRPESRRRLVTLATRLGLRPFDANLIIAIVQDGARRGAPPHDPELHGRLRLIDAPKPRRMSIRTRPQRGGGPRSESGRPTIERWILAIRAVAAALLAVLLAAAMAAWLIGLL